MSLPFYHPNRIVRADSDVPHRCTSQRVAALVRPSSASKPEVAALRTAGVDIRIGDLYDDFEKLKAHLAGVDILVSSVVPWAIADQKDIIRAAKEVGVQRVVPCEFATPGEKGVRGLHDTVRPLTSTPQTQRRGAPQGQPSAHCSVFTC